MAKKVINIISTVILVFLIILVIFLFVVRMSGKAPSIFGYQVFRVSSESMEPTLMKGDVILVKKVDFSEIHKDDIITYQSRAGELNGQMITHRVVLEPTRDGNNYYFQTQGDKDGAALDPIVSDSQVQGLYIKKLALIDKMYAFFFTKYGLILFVFLIVVLFGYEMVSLLLSYRSLDEKDDDYYEPKPKKPRKKRKKG